MNKIKLGLACVLLVPLHFLLAAPEIRLAFSKKDNIEILVKTTDGKNWCASQVPLRFIGQDADYYDGVEFKVLYAKLRSVIESNCSKVDTINVVASKTKKSEKIYSAVAKKSNEWSLVAEQTKKEVAEMPKTKAPVTQPAEPVKTEVAETPKTEAPTTQPAEPVKTEIAETAKVAAPVTQPTEPVKTEVAERNPSKSSARKAAISVSQNSELKPEPLNYFAVKSIQKYYQPEEVSTLSLVSSYAKSNECAAMDTARGDSARREIIDKAIPIVEKKFKSLSKGLPLFYYNRKAESVAYDTENKSYHIYLDQNFKLNLKNNLQNGRRTHCWSYEDYFLKTLLPMQAISYPVTTDEYRALTVSRDKYSKLKKGFYLKIYIKAVGYRNHTIIYERDHVDFYFDEEHKHLAFTVDSDRIEKQKQVVSKTYQLDQIPTAIEAKPMWRFDVAYLMKQFNPKSVNQQQLLTTYINRTMCKESKSKEDEFSYKSFLQDKVMPRFNKVVKSPREIYELNYAKAQYSDYNYDKEQYIVDLDENVRYRQDDIPTACGRYGNNFDFETNVKPNRALGKIVLKMSPEAAKDFYNRQHAENPRNRYLYTSLFVKPTGYNSEKKELYYDLDSIALYFDEDREKLAYTLTKKDIDLIFEKRDAKAQAVRDEAKRKADEIAAKKAELEAEQARLEALKPKAMDYFYARLIQHFYQPKEVSRDLLLDTYARLYECREFRSDQAKAIGKVTAIVDENLKITSKGLPTFYYTTGVSYDPYNKADQYYRFYLGQKFSFSSEGRCGENQSYSLMPLTPMSTIDYQMTPEQSANFKKKNSDYSINNKIYAKVSIRVAGYDNRKVLYQIKQIDFYFDYKYKDLAFTITSDQLEKEEQAIRAKYQLDEIPSPKQVASIDSFAVLSTARQHDPQVITQKGLLEVYIQSRMCQQNKKQKDEFSYKSFLEKVKPDFEQTVKSPKAFYAFSSEVIYGDYDYDKGQYVIPLKGEINYRGDGYFNCGRYGKPPKYSVTLKPADPIKTIDLKMAADAAKDFYNRQHRVTSYSRQLFVRSFIKMKNYDSTNHTLYYDLEAIEVFFDQKFDQLAYTVTKKEIDQIVKANRAAQEAKIKAEKEAQEARIKAEKEAQKARIEAERAAKKEKMRDSYLNIKEKLNAAESETEKYEVAKDYLRRNKLLVDTLYVKSYSKEDHRLVYSWSGKGEIIGIVSDDLPITTGWGFVAIKERDPLFLEVDEQSEEDSMSYADLQKVQEQLQGKDGLLLPLIIVSNFKACEKDYCEEILDPVYLVQQAFKDPDWQPESTEE